MTERVRSAGLGGRFTLPGTSIHLNRLGYGAMKLAGPHVFGLPRDRATAIAVLREAVALGVNHIDTSDFYGPHVTNQIIREALHPYPETLTIVIKVGARRGEDGSWHAAQSQAELTNAVHDNLRNLGLDVLDVVNMRLWDGTIGRKRDRLPSSSTHLLNFSSKASSGTSASAMHRRPRLRKRTRLLRWSACRTRTTSRSAMMMR